MNFERITKEIQETITKMSDQTERLALAISDSQERYEAAKKKKEAALAANDREAYISAGTAAEKARLDMEFSEQMAKQAAKRPGASAEDDLRIRMAISAECVTTARSAVRAIEKHLKEIVQIAESASAVINQADTVKRSWKTVVMKENPSNDPPLLGTEYLFLGQFANAANGQLQRMDYVKKGHNWSD